MADTTLTWDHVISNFAMTVDESGRFVLQEVKKENPILVKAREDLAAGISYQFIRNNLAQRADYYYKFQMNKELDELTEVIETLDKEYLKKKVEK